MDQIVKTIQILLVDDSPEDIQLTKFAFKKANVPNKISVAKDGQECLNYLTSRLNNTEPLPDLILLDLNMPKKGGKEVLEEIKVDKRLRMIPVIVLTTSQSNEDITGSYERYANGYVSKPIDFNHFGEVVKVIESFWLNLVKLPQHLPDTE